jgi:hypothetical protein
VGLPYFNPSYQMKILIINTHLTYPGWSEGKLNLAFMNLAKAFFVAAHVKTPAASMARAAKCRERSS